MVEVKVKDKLKLLLLVFVVWGLLFKKMLGVKKVFFGFKKVFLVVVVLLLEFLFLFVLLVVVCFGFVGSKFGKLGFGGFKVL